MPSRQIRIPLRSNLRVLLLGGAALCALTGVAAAADLPATPDGAAKLNAFFSTYIGAAPAGAPRAYSVTPEGSDYLVAIDIAALTAPLKSEGITYDPAIITFKAFAQDDGEWRIEQGDFPSLAAHTKRGDVNLDTTIVATGVKGVTLIDPAISWMKSHQGGADKVAVRAHGTGIEETVDVSAAQTSATTAAASDGTLAWTAQQLLGAVALTMAVDPKAMKPDSAAQPFTIGAQADQAAVEVKLNGLKPRPLLDLWAFLAAHPARPDLAANEPALKTLLNAALAAPLSVDETIGTQTLTVQTPKGSVVFQGAKIGVGGAAAGPASRFEEHFSATGLSLPVGMVPPMFHDFVPAAFDIGFKVSGIDLTAASGEAVGDMHLAGDGPPLSPEDRGKVWAKLVGGAPVTIEVPPSHIVGPHLNLTIEAKIDYENGRPSGKFIVHMRDFESTMTALKGLGPEAERKLVPMVAMAKGLARTDPDGALTWVGELGRDGAMKVNGLPLGKAPI